MVASVYIVGVIHIAHEKKKKKKKTDCSCMKSKTHFQHKIKTNIIMKNSILSSRPSTYNTKTKREPVIKHTIFRLIFESTR